jgi:hypothetical protein
MAFGKKLARFSFQWSAIGIFIYLMDPESSNTFGRSAVTFRMYCKQKQFLQNRLYLLFLLGLLFDLEDGGITWLSG